MHKLTINKPCSIIEKMQEPAISILPSNIIYPVELTTMEDGQFYIKYSTTDDNYMYKVFYL